MTVRRLFDVILEVSGDDDTGAGIIAVSIVNQYDGGGRTPGDVIAARPADTLDDAMTFARGAVTAFLHGTTAQPTE